MKTIHELLSLSGKTAVVTGGANGIGRGICFRLAEAGAQVLVADIDEKAARETARELTDQGWLAAAVNVDVRHEEQIKDLVSTCKDRFGSLDVVVNDVGVFPFAPLSEMTGEMFDHVMQVNLRSVFLVTKHAAEVMKEQGGGRIINITSIDAVHPSAVGFAHYDASKHGLWGFTKNAALELAPHKIWVNAIAPGSIATPGTAELRGATADMAGEFESFLEQIAMRRIGEPDEIATVALFLASEMSSYMTGEQIVVDGGALLT